MRRRRLGLRKPSGPALRRTPTLADVAALASRARSAIRPAKTSRCGCREALNLIEARHPAMEFLVRGRGRAGQPASQGAAGQPEMPTAGKLDGS
jgi:hypothetical protein